jgi:hypothetical protein
MIEWEDVADDRSGRGGFGEGEAVRGVDGERGGEGGEEFLGVGEGVRAGLGVGTEAGDVAPDGLFVGAALDEERPAREWFAGVVFAGGFEDDGAGEGVVDEFAGETAGVVEFGGADRGGLPLGAAGGDGNEGGLATHGKEHAAAREGGFDGIAAGAEGFPGGGGVGGGGHGTKKETERGGEGGRGRTITRTRTKRPHGLGAGRYRVLDRQSGVEIRGDGVGAEEAALDGVDAFGEGGVGDGDERHRRRKCRAWDRGRASRRRGDRPSAHACMVGGSGLRMPGGRAARGGSR